MTHLVNVAPGQILPGPYQVIPRIIVKSPAEKIAVQIPGEILRAGDIHLLRILPYAMLEHDGEGILITASVASDSRLDAECGHLEEALGLEPLIRFGLRLSAGAATFEELADAASEAGDCGCSGSSKPKSLAGGIEVGVAAGAAMQWSGLVRARIFPRLVDLGRSKGRGDFLWHAFDCYSNWSYEWGNGRRRTDCGGSCPAPATCVCEQLPGRTRRSCVGWITCWCV